MKQSFGDKFWKDKHGNVAVVQFPNMFLVLWITTSLLSRLFERGIIHSLMNVLAFSTLFTWACLEMISGDSYFRRLLGLAVLIVTVMNRL